MKHRGYDFTLDGIAGGWIGTVELGGKKYKSQHEPDPADAIREIKGKIDYYIEHGHVRPPERRRGRRKDEKGGTNKR